MSNFIDNMRTLFDFLFDVLGDVSSFFTTNTLGIIILGVVVFTLIVEVVISFIGKFHK